MADNPTYIPHLLGITLNSSGVAYTQVVAFNKRTGEYQIKAADGNKVVVFDAADFTSGYDASDVIYFENVGSSVGSTTITINSTTGGFQEATMTCATAPTVAVNL